MKRGSFHGLCCFLSHQLTHPCSAESLGESAGKRIAEEGVGGGRGPSDRKDGARSHSREERLRGYLGLRGHCHMCRVMCPESEPLRPDPKAQAGHVCVY